MKSLARALRSCDATATPVINIYLELPSFPIVACTPRDIPRLKYLLASEAMAKKRPGHDTTSLWFIESRAAERKLREDSKKKPKKKTKAS